MNSYGTCFLNCRDSILCARFMMRASHNKHVDLISVKTKMLVRGVYNIL